MDKKYTIKDIARLAGVSKGTVDRVLHKRGKVSDKAQERVEKVLKKIDYQPNPIARNLKNNKVYTINVLMPNPTEDAYWIPAVQGIEDATKKFKSFGISVRIFYYNPTSQDSFIQKSQKALQTPPDALLMTPLFQEAAFEIRNQCQDKNVLVALFNNAIDSFQGENFIGQDLYQSGRVAASLIDKLVVENTSTAVLHLNEEANMKLREKGFRAYFKEKNESPKINTFTLNTANQEIFKRSALELLKNNPEISALFITNSKAYLFLKAIQSLCKDIRVVGYDLLEENIDLLKAGCIDFLIHQKPKSQGYLGVSYLAEYFLFGKQIPSKNLLPIDIITPENASYY